MGHHKISSYLIFNEVLPYTANHVSARSAERSLIYPSIRSHLGGRGVTGVSDTVTPTIVEIIVRALLVSVHGAQSTAGQ